MAYQFLITLQDVSSPKVWRRILVPEKYNFEQLHIAIQSSFGWTNSHLYEFTAKELEYPISEPAPDFPEQRCIPAYDFPMSEFFTKAGKSCSYEYDFGDGWLHSVKLEAVTPTNVHRARCIAGEGQCPPEDCGGVPGYERLKKVMAAPRVEDEECYEEYEEMREWLDLGEGEVWNPVRFDLRETNDRLRWPGSDDED